MATAAIEAERQRQIEAEGFDAARDDGYTERQLWAAGVCYFERATLEVPAYPAPKGWPWAKRWWKPGTAERDLIRAGALMLAEIDRMRRLKLSLGRAGKCLPTAAAPGLHSRIVRLLAIIYRDRAECAHASEGAHNG
jgi:hypothetical protein